MGKRALVLSGGGAQGAYQVGVIKALTEHGRSWDVIEGVSVGAISGTQLAMFQPEHHREASLELEKLWLEDIQGNKSIYKKHLPWILNYLASLWKGSLYNTEPLLKLIKHRFSKDRLLDSGVDFKVGVVGLKTGIYKSVSTRDITPEWIQASATMPLLFNPIQIGGELWVDGGVRNIAPLDAMAKRDDVSEIDVVLADNHGNLDFSSKNFNNIVNVALRCTEIAIDEVGTTDLDSVYYETKYGKKKITVYSPKEHHSYDAFDFNPTKLKEAMEIGYQETKAKLV